MFSSIMPAGSSFNGVDANSILANNQARALLLGTAPRMTKDLGITNGAAGGNTRVKLFNVGIVTSLDIVVTIPVTIGVATAVVSKRGPYNMIQRLKVTDFTGTDRVNLSGYQLFVLDSVRQAFPYGLHDLSGTSAIITNPAYAVATGAQTITFMLNVPIAYDPENDLRGAIFAQSNLGEFNLSIDWNASYVSTAGDIDSLYSGAGTTTVVSAGNITVEVFQNFLAPQNIGNGVPTPVLDLFTVYELAGVQRTTDNLAVGTVKFLNYPNARSVIGAYYNYINGGTYNANDISRFQQVANGNAVIIDHTLFKQQMVQRNYMAADLAAGTYWFRHLARPIATNQYGNYQATITPSVVSAGNTGIEVAYESFYTMGQSLPGFVQG
jgi:hypothetical protein